MHTEKLTLPSSRSLRAIWPFVEDEDSLTVVSLAVWVCIPLQCAWRRILLDKFKVLTMMCEISKTLLCPFWYDRLKICGWHIFSFGKPTHVFIYFTWEKNIYSGFAVLPLVEGKKKGRYKSVRWSWMRSFCSLTYPSSAAASFNILICSSVRRLCGYSHMFVLPSLLPI